MNTVVDESFNHLELLCDLDVPSYNLPQALHHHHSILIGPQGCGRKTVLRIASCATGHEVSRIQFLDMCVEAITHFHGNL